MLEVTIAEVSKTLLSRFGLDFSRMIRSGDRTISVLSGIVGGAPGLLARFAGNLSRPVSAGPPASERRASGSASATAGRRRNRGRSLHHQAADHQQELLDPGHRRQEERRHRARAGRAQHHGHQRPAGQLPLGRAHLHPGGAIVRHRRRADHHAAGEGIRRQPEVHADGAGRPHQPEGHLRGVRAVADRQRPSPPSAASLRCCPASPRARWTRRCSWATARASRWLA